MYRLFFKCASSSWQAPPIADTSSEVDRFNRFERNRGGGLVSLPGMQARSFQAALPALCVAELTMPSFAFASAHRGQENWLQLDHRVLEHDLPKKPGPAILHFAVRYVWVQPAFTSFFCFYFYFSTFLVIRDSV